MRQVDWYLDTARARLGATSDGDLARKIGFSREAISQWRTRRAWPTAGRMVRLAEVCGVDPHVALAELGTWREPDVSAWRDLVQRLGAPLVLALAVYFGDGDSGAQAANIAPPKSQQVYIMRLLRMRLACKLSALHLAFLTLRHYKPRLVARFVVSLLPCPFECC